MSSPNKTTFSFEIFPPKPTSEPSVIYGTLDALQGLKPDFISVTYGAGGGANCKNTVGIASYIQNTCQTESVAHLPCLYLSESDLNGILEQLRENGIHNILALRGDRSETATPNGRFSHANELISYIHDYDSSFHLMAACYPEGHPEQHSPAEELETLKRKVDAGASQFITQLFLDNDAFDTYRNKVAQAGISVPIEAGIMPVTNKKQIERMVKLCGATLPKKFLHILNKHEDNPEALRDAGVAYAIEQIVDLIAQDVDGIHLYTMNRADVARKIDHAVHRLLQ